MAGPAYARMQVEERRRQLLERGRSAFEMLGSLGGSLTAAGAADLLSAAASP